MADQIKTCGIMVDDWKLPIFVKRLEAAGLPFENKGLITGNVIVLQVKTTNPQALAQLCLAANNEAAQARREPE